MNRNSTILRVCAGFMVFFGCLGIRFADDEGPGIFLSGALILSGIVLFFWLAEMKKKKGQDQ